MRFQSLEIVSSPLEPHPNLFEGSLIKRELIKSLSDHGKLEGKIKFTSKIFLNVKYSVLSLNGEHL
jgi:hypothetical protein